MLVAGDIKVRQLGWRIACILSDETDPLKTTLRIYFPLCFPSTLRRSKLSSGRKKIWSGSMRRVT